jgi:hypothetical protein
MIYGQRGNTSCPTGWSTVTVGIKECYVENVDENEE